MANGRFLERMDTRLSIMDWMWRAGIAIMSFGVPAWAAYATEWLNSYGPVAWVGAGFAGLLIVSIVTYIGAITYGRIQRTKLLKRISERPDAVNPLDQYFQSKRINLQWFVPPSGDAVENKTFVKCEIIGPLNIIPFGCTIMKSIYVSADYIMIKDDSLEFTESHLHPIVRNGHLFKNCTFSECKFYFVSFLVAEVAFEAFDRTGGCNWITDTSHRQLALTVASPPPS